MSLQKDRNTANRCAMLDTLRGLTVVNMILFHAVWDLVYIFGMDWHWYHGTGAYIWQQCICWTFILLSGFCAGMGKHTLRRGLIVFVLGTVVSVVTAVFMPEDLIVFGVLTLIGSCMILTALLKSCLQKIPPTVGLVVSFVLFAFTKHVNAGYVGMFKYQLAQLPGWLYQNYVTAYFGFPQPDFYSTDYFSLLPWLFLFLSGFFLFQLAGKQILSVRWKGLALLNFIGRHALEIYVVHQPVIYGILFLWDMAIHSVN